MLALPTIALFLLAAVQDAIAYDCKSQTYGACEDTIVHRYDLDDGQICDPLDCGGGRAPVKYNVPCCAAYTGTEACVNTPSYMPCLKRAAATSAPAPAPVTTQEVPASATPVIVAEPSPTSAPPVSSAAAPAQTSVPAIQPTASSQVITILPLVSSVQASVASSNGNITLASSTTRASLSSSSVSASRAAQSSGAADSLRSGPAVALIGLVLGLGL